MPGQSVEQAARSSQSTLFSPPIPLSLKASRALFEAFVFLLVGNTHALITLRSTACCFPMGDLGQTRFRTEADGSMHHIFTQHTDTRHTMVYYRYNAWVSINANETTNCLWSIRSDGPVLMATPIGFTEMASMLMEQNSDVYWPSLDCFWRGSLRHWQRTSQPIEYRLQQIIEYCEQNNSVTSIKMLNHVSARRCLEKVGGLSQVRLEWNRVRCKNLCRSDDFRQNVEMYDPVPRIHSPKPMRPTFSFPETLLGKT